MVAGRDGRKLGARGLMHKSPDPVVARMGLHDEGSPLVDAPLVVFFEGPVGRAHFPQIAPLFAMISGMRKEPPISISSPRPMMTSLPSASVLRPRSTAAALLLTTRVGFSPGQPLKEGEQCSWRSPLLPSARSYSRFE